MLIYIFTFIIAILATALAQKCFKTKNGAMGIVLSFIVILFPSVLAGCRDLEIGTDVLKYLIDTFYEAKSSSSLSAFMKMNQTEPLFAILSYTVISLTDSIHWLMFFIQLLIMILIYSIAYYYRKSISMWLVMLMFFLMMYNTTYNMMRQSIALFFCLYSFRYIETKKIFKFLFCILLAFGFHITALLFLIVYPLYHIYSTLSYKKIFIVQSILILFSVIFILLYNEILLGIVAIGILPPKFIQYTSEGDAFESFFSYSEFALRIVILCVVFYSYKTKLLGKRIGSFYLFIVIFELICTTASLYSKYASRISLYYFMLNFIYIPLIFSKSKYRILFQILFISFLIYYWYFMFVVSGASETYPYKSKILDNLLISK